MDTILSRCLALRFGDGDPPLPERVQRWLERFAEAMRRPGRSLLNRYQVLGDLLSELGEVRSGVEKALKSQSPLQEYDDADSKLRDRWEDELKAGVESEYRRVRADFLNGLQWFFRDVWFQAAGAGDGLLALPQLREATGEIAARASAANASRNLEALNRAQRLLETNLQESLVLEVALLRLRL